MGRRRKMNLESIKSLFSKGSLYKESLKLSPEFSSAQEAHSHYGAELKKALNSLSMSETDLLNYIDNSAEYNEKVESAYDLYRKKSNYSKQIS